MSSGADAAAGCGGSSGAFPKRTHTCGELRIEDAGSDVILNGWIESRRDMGSLCFLDLRDRYGITQVRFDTELDPKLLDVAHRVRPEYVLAVCGRVVPRPEGMTNRERATGAVEVEASSVMILSEARTPPFEIKDDVAVSDELRLRYRYLDLRRRPLQENLIRRHRMVLALRRVFDEQGFIEVETPGLTRSMPEGARDYIVPSRVSPGSFYALPQSPQLFKQLLMVAGFDRYVQIVKCFRDEDLRADRQPEFTQLDVEMSFADEETVFEVLEGAVAAAVEAVRGQRITPPFPRLTHEEAMASYGVDKPDLRYGLLIVDITEAVGASDSQMLKKAIEQGGCARAIRVPAGATMTRREIESMEAVAKEAGAKGLGWMKVSGATALQGGLSKLFAGRAATMLCERLEAETGDLIVLVADSASVTARALGEVRRALAKHLGLVPDDELRFCWVTDFPMFERDEETGRVVSTHHPFTMPRETAAGQIEADPLAVKARSYDLVLNGWELGSGGVRIHDPDLQQRVFTALSISPEQARQRFGFLLDALRFGAPPHCGIALGVDRLAALLVDAPNIREVVAFPKTATAACLMTGSPAEVDPSLLEDLGIDLRQRPDSPTAAGESSD